MMTGSSRKSHYERKWTPLPQLEPAPSWGAAGTGPAASGDLWELAPDTSRTRSLPDGRLGTRNAASGQGSGQEQLLTAQGQRCKSGVGRETGVRLEEGKRGVRRRARRGGLAGRQGCRDANTGDQAGRTFSSPLCQDAEHNTGPREDVRSQGGRFQSWRVGGWRKRENSCYRARERHSG